MLFDFHQCLVGLLPFQPERFSRQWLWQSMGLHFSQYTPLPGHAVASTGRQRVHNAPNVFVRNVGWAWFIGVASPQAPARGKCCGSAVRSRVFGDQPSRRSLIVQRLQPACIARLPRPKTWRELRRAGSGLSPWPQVDRWRRDLRCNVPPLLRRRQAGASATDWANHPAGRSLQDASPER